MVVDSKVNDLLIRHPQRWTVICTPLMLDFSDQPRTIMDSSTAHNDALEVKLREKHYYLYSLQGRDLSLISVCQASPIVQNYTVVNRKRDVWRVPNCYHCESASLDLAFSIRKNMCDSTSQTTEEKSRERTMMNLSCGCLPGR